MKLRDQARFAQSGLAYDQRYLSVAVLSSVPAPHQQGNLLIASYKRRLMAESFVVSGAAGTVTVKVRANTPSGSLLIANGGSASVLLVEDVGPKP